MTNEKIKEEFDRFYEKRFIGQIYAGTEFKKIAFEIWIAAERLAKIEVLEEITAKCEDMEQADYVISEMKDRIKLLKAGQ